MDFRFVSHFQMLGLRVSVIVPTLDEEDTIIATLEDIWGRRPHEVIVVDGGSRDRTQALAVPRATRVLVEGGGLARQLNRGALAATGEVLLFHFADVRLPERGLEAVISSLEEPGVVGGAFRLGFDSHRPFFRLVALLGNLRNRLGFGPFGDQAIFVGKEIFERLGGFEPEAPLEDLDLVRRLRRAGRFVILKDPVRTSVRRWEADGLLRTSLHHLLASLFYLLGAERKAKAIKRFLLSRRVKGSAGPSTGK